MASAQATAETSGRTAWVLATLLVVGFLFRMGCVASKSTFIDEVWQIGWAKGYPMDNVVDARALDLGVRMPVRDLSSAIRTVHHETASLNVLLLNLWMQTLGSDDDVVLRLLYVIIGTLTVFVAFHLGAEFGGATMGLALAAIIALSPFHVYYSQEINHYAPATLFTCASFLFTARWLRTATPRDAVGSALSSALACYGHYYAGLAVASQFLAIAFHERRSLGQVLRKTAPIIAAVGLVLVDLRAILVHLRANTPEAYSGAFGGLRYFTARLFLDLLYYVVGTGSDRVSSVVGALVLALVVTVFVGGVRQVRDPSKRAIMVWATALPLVAISAAYFVWRKNQVLWPRYFIFHTLMPYAGLAAYIAMARTRAARVGIASFLLLIQSWGLYCWYSRTEKQDWKMAASAVERYGRPPEPILVILPNFVHSLGRYLRTNNVMYGLTGAPSVDEELTLATKDAQGVWLMVASSPDAAANEKIRSWLACRYERHEIHHAFDISITRYLGRREGSSICGLRNAFDESEECVVEGPRLGKVRGWIEAPQSATVVSVEDGAGRRWTVRAAPGWASASVPVPNKGSSPKRHSFEADISAQDVPLGTAVRVWPVVQLPDGTLRRGIDAISCLHRPATRRHTGLTVVQASLAKPPRSCATVGPGLTAISGWAFSGLGIAAMVAEVDGQVVKTSRWHGLVREDVAKVFTAMDRELTLYSGFRILVPLVSSGRHEVAVRALDPDGKEVWMDKNILVVR